MRPYRTLAVPALTCLALTALAAPASAHEEGAAAGQVLVAPSTVGTATGGMTHLANVQYPASAGESQGGTDVEFLKLGAKEYAVAGTVSNGMQIVDITTPTAPVLVATYDCPINQGDVQVFRQGARVLATYTEDGGFTTAEQVGNKCGVTLPLDSRGTFRGTILVDLTNPLTPTPLTAIEISTGSHNMSVHPSGNFLYNSNSDLATDTTPTIEIIDITNPAAPVRLPDFSYPSTATPVGPGLPTCTSLGCNSHDVTFRPDGNRAYSASLNTTLILNTEDPRKPVLIEQIENPRISLEHDVKYLPLAKPDGSTRELLLVGDELAGAAGNGTCPGGGITVFDITGGLETNPVDLGTWFINDQTGARDTGNGAGVGGSTRCTAHVFQLYPQQGLLTVAWYQRGVRVLDVSGLATYVGQAVPEQAIDGDGVGMKEIGSFFFPEDSDTWSFKTNRIAANGSFFGYGNDLSRGFDVYQFPGFTGKTVAPLEPTDFAPGADPVIPEAPVTALLAVAGLAIAGAVVLRRRQFGASAA